MKNAPAADRTGAFKRIGVAVSGGADSVALLLLLAAERSGDPSLYTCVLHADHGLRAESSDDARFVKALCAELGVPFFSRRLHVKRRAGESTEMAARAARLGFFRDAVKRHGLDAIATGHHADDAAETFFLRLARGAGLSGLAGLKKESTVPGIRFVRPLLDVPDAELRRFLRDNGQDWREDSTNADVSIARNRVRREVVPALERMLDPTLRRHLRQTLEILREEDEYMEEAARKALDAGASPAALPKALARRAARMVLRAQGAADGFAETEAFLSGKTASVRAPDAPAPAEPPRFTLEISPATGWKRSSEGIGAFPAFAWLGADALAGRELEVRARRAGDRIAPHGLSGSRKLKDVFADAKVPHAMRDTLPLVADRNSGEVLWVPGYRVAAAAAVPSGAAPSWKFVLRKERA